MSVGNNAYTAKLLDLVLEHGVDARDETFILHIIPRVGNRTNDVAQTAGVTDQGWGGSTVILVGHCFCCSHIRSWP